MTGIGNVDGADLAIRSGAWDYIERPDSVHMMALPRVRALQYREIKLQERPQTKLTREGIVGSSLPMMACLEKIAQAAASDVSVLITAETGTGKKLFARAIHENSHRSASPFVVLDCATLSDTLVESILFGHEKGAFASPDRSREGLVKQADGGSLFLDEIGELPIGVQPAFLRVLQEHCFLPSGARNREASSA